MKVYKFGGASINSIDRFKSTAEIIKDETGKLIIVVSAMGKITNSLEKVAEAFYAQRKEDALKLFEKIKEHHLNLVKYLTTKNWKETEDRLKDIFTEVEWLLHDNPVRNYDYYYDQIVGTGELMSSTIFKNYLQENGVDCQWLDIRDVIRTDNNFRNAQVQHPATQEKINQTLLPHFQNTNVIITQGFIGSTDENETTTLGREGSDYTAALIAAGVNAESVTIWKDVDAVMNADPRLFNDAVIMPFLSYAEIIEMAYYGAQVIHPKTIKPLKNKNIPLFVKSFLDVDLPGTVINNNIQNKLPPVIINKENQVLISFKSIDFSFVEGKPATALNEILNDLKIKTNLSQHTAISYLVCIDDQQEKIEALALTASSLFDVSVEKNLELITIRHYDKEIVDKLTLNRQIVLEQKTEQTVQFLMRK